MVVRNPTQRETGRFISPPLFALGARLRSSRDRLATKGKAAQITPHARGKCRDAWSRCQLFATRHRLGTRSNPDRALTGVRLSAKSCSAESGQRSLRAMSNHDAGPQNSKRPANMPSVVDREKLGAARHA